MGDLETPQIVGAEGLDVLYRRHAQWLASALSRRVGADAAADLVQETYLRLAPQDTRTIRHPKAFLIRVAMNVLRDGARRDKRRHAAHDEVARGRGQTQPDEAVLLKQIITTMPKLYRDVFILSRFRGMSYAEIAAAQGVGVKAIEWRMSRALEHCAARLDE